MATRTDRCLRSHSKQEVPDQHILALPERSLSFVCSIRVEVLSSEQASSVSGPWPSWTWGTSLLSALLCFNTCKLYFSYPCLIYIMSYVCPFCLYLCCFCLCVLFSEQKNRTTFNDGMNRLFSLCIWAECLHFPFYSSVSRLWGWKKWWPLFSIQRLKEGDSTWLW